MALTIASCAEFEFIRNSTSSVAILRYNLRLVVRGWFEVFNMIRCSSLKRLAVVRAQFNPLPWICLILVCLKQSETNFLF